MFIAEIQTMIDDHGHILGRYPLAFLPPVGTKISLNLQRPLPDFPSAETVSCVVSDDAHVKLGDPVADVILFVEDIDHAGFALPDIAEPPRR